MHKRTFLTVAALWVAAAAAQSAQRPNPLDANAKVPAAEYRSAFDGFRPFAEEDLADWRKSNEEVGAAGGHAGHQAGQSRGEPTSKPQPGSQESSGRQAPQGGHGGHHR